MSASGQDAGTSPPDYRWVADRSSLEELALELERAPGHAFDSESNSGFVYREQLCLLQFNIEGRLWLVDLLALSGGGRALEPIRRPLESETLATWVHGGEFDVGSMKRDYGIELGGLWDTQQAASFLGWEKTGYGAVVERICAVALDKAFAHYDWGRRPLAQALLNYALDDVLYLPEVARELERRVEAADLVDEVAIANRAVMDATWSGPAQRNGIWRLKRINKLDERHLPRLVALWEWREAEAKRRDLPPGRLLHPERLMALARRRVKSLRELRALGLRGRNAGYAEEILGVLKHAAAHPPRVPPRPKTARQTPGESRRLKKLREWRRAEAERRGVGEAVVLPPTAMLHLARHGTDDLRAVPQLGDKRIRLYGESLARICA